MSYYQEPPTSPVSTPELAEKYPLVLTTGKRSFEFFHSEWRQPETISRQLHPDPMFDIHPDTAAEHGIIDGDWVWIENQMGKMKQRARLNPSLDPRVVSTEHGWWFPERDPEEPNLFGVFDCNPNNLIPQCENGTNGYGAPIKCGMCTVYKVTPENDKQEDEPTYQVCTTGYTHGKTHISDKPSFYKGYRGRFRVPIRSHLLWNVSRLPFAECTGDRSEGDACYPHDLPRSQPGCPQLTNAVISKYVRRTDPCTTPTSGSSHCQSTNRLFRSHLSTLLESASAKRPLAHCLYSQ